MEDGYETINFASSGEHDVSQDKIDENYEQAKLYKNLYKRMYEKSLNKLLFFLELKTKRLHKLSGELTLTIINYSP